MDTLEVSAPLLLDGQQLRPVHGRSRIVSPQPCGERTHTDEPYVPLLDTPTGRLESGCPSEESHITKQNEQNRSEDSRETPILHAIPGLWAAWWWELVTWLVGSLALLAIYILLRCFHNVPLSKWKGPVQITSVVALLTQVASTALLVSVSSSLGQLKWTRLLREQTAIEVKMIEEAGRSPQGGLKLLWHLVQKKRRSYLIALGALTVLLMQTFSFFTQQAVAVELHKSSQPNNANITRAVTYTPPRQSSLNFGPDSSTINSGSSGFGIGSQGDEDLYLAAAINAGLFDNSKTLDDVTGSCPTDQCTWDPYFTMAICTSQLEDVTSTIIDRGGDNSPETNYRFSVPALGNDPRVSSAAEGITFWMRSLYFGGSSNTSNETALTLPDIEEIVVLFASPCAIAKFNTSLQASWTAFRGTLSLCLQKLNSTYIDGFMNTTVLYTYRDINWQQTEQDVYCGQLNNTSERYCIYSLENIAAEIATFFTGNASLKPGGDNYYSSLPIEVLATDILGTDPTICNNKSDIGLHGFTRRLNTTALALTNAIRTSQNSSVVSGISWTTEQVIRVELLWLIMPALMQAGVTLLLFVTMQRTMASGAPLWKSSPLVLLRCMSADNGLASDKEAEEQAKRNRLQLLRTERGWQLVDSRTAEGKGLA